MYKAFGKRLIDIILATCGMIVLSPVFALVALAVFIDDPGPIIFAQKRVGRKKDGKITYFELYKFRSMKVNAPRDVPTHLLVNPAQYNTRLGKLLRKTSLDELPQCWNILKGDMSFIGPRPALWNQEDLVAEREKYGANNVTPGLSGWAQVNGRDELTIEEKAMLDGEYAQNLSLKMDWKCLCMTIPNVLKSSGIVEGNSETVDKQEKKRISM